jgi:hypothetical protein
VQLYLLLIYLFSISLNQFTDKTRISFRDALYRLARDTKQQLVVDDLDGDVSMQEPMPWAVHNESLRYMIYICCIILVLVWIDIEIVRITLGHRDFGKSYTLKLIEKIKTYHIIIKINI